MLRRLFLACALMAFVAAAGAANETARSEWPLDAEWRTIAGEANAGNPAGFEAPSFDDSTWKRVDVPHNWDDYAGLQRVPHGNRHGTAWYRRRFDVAETEKGRRVFLFFEGVGSYATVWVNGQLVGSHAGGRTTFTLEVTGLVNVGGENVLAVRADHPEGLTDLPWVCGGCSSAQGFSEGSQPMGLFRPVHLITTGNVRVEPFGVHVWNDADANEERANVHVATELNRTSSEGETELVTRIRGADGAVLAEGRDLVQFNGNTARVQRDFSLGDVALWSLESPTLYTVETEVRQGGSLMDRVKTSFGIRTVQWPDPEAKESAPFRLNGRPVFINGTCGYEHVLGASHAFSDEQIRTRVRQVQATGFNAFRDAHQPHNLRYQEYWDNEGVLWWPQMVAQIWFDTPEFRENFKRLLRQWVRERRNSPSVVLWGLANESKLPEDFAAECTAIIRELDPTASSQRLVTTCNGGKGTDWNVPQNWTGTYGGNPAEYAQDLLRQRLIGEYGAWRSLGLHSEGGFVADGVRSEDRANALFEMKIQLAETVRDRVPGHFHWLLATHENPGRVIGSKGQQGTDGWAELDRIGPANNKGLLTLWGEPTDAFYLYRASYVSGEKDPMVYIVSHTWPDRWTESGVKSGIQVYSNCDEVELFNDVGVRSLGVRQQGGPGTAFRWDNVAIATNVLYAEGRIAGRTVARDAIVLRHLPEAPNRWRLNGEITPIVRGESELNYVYRVNCGGGDYVDQHGQRWLADREYAPGQAWGSNSWAEEFPHLPARFGSQREFYDPIGGTRDEPLFQTYRYGREKLRYRFAVPNGEYRVELYFTEPWYGRGGGDAAGWRLFDVAVNGETRLRDVDLWKEAGYARAVKKVVNARASQGWIEISFPRVTSYQAVVSAIAIATGDLTIAPAADREAPTEGGRVEMATEMTTADLGDVYPVAAAKREGTTLSWRIETGLGGSHDMLVRYASGATPVDVELTVIADDGTVLDAEQWTLAPTHGRVLAGAPERGLEFNAGSYTVTLSPLRPGELRVESLTVR